MAAAGDRRTLERQVLSDDVLPADDKALAHSAAELQSVCRVGATAQAPGVTLKSQRLTHSSRAHGSRTHTGQTVATTRGSHR